jgi:CheY-like chemotaxis protein
MSAPAGRSSAVAGARGVGLEVEARDRLDGEATGAVAAGSAGAPAPESSGWDDSTSSRFETEAAPSGRSPSPAAVTDTPRNEREYDRTITPEILLADADPAIGAAIEQAMVNKGWSVRRVTDGQMAVAEFLRLAPHCFVFDYSLPGLGGLDLLQKLADYGIAEHSRLVVNSTQTQAIHVQRARAAGADRFLDRPRRSTDQLVGAVHGQLVELGVLIPDGDVNPSTVSPPQPAPDAAAPPPPGGLFIPGSTSSPSQQSSPTGPARPGSNRPYRSAFGLGGGPPGQVPRLD